MRKKFIINIALLVTLNLLIKPFWVFGIDRTFQNMVGLSEYGLLFTIYNLSVLLNILLDLGINNFNTRAVSQNTSSVYNYLPNILTIKILLGLIYFAITFFIAFIVGFESRYFNLLLLLTFNQFLLSYIMFFRTNISGLQLYTTDSILSVADRFIMIISYLFAYYIFFQKSPFTIEWFVGIQTISYLISGSLIALTLYKKTGKIPYRFRIKMAYGIVKKSLPYALLIFLMAAYSRIDTIMLERMLPEGTREAGIYAQSFRILDSVLMLSVLFAGLLFPMFSNMLSENKDIKPFTKMAFNLLWMISVSFSLTAFFCAENIIDLLYTDGGSYSARVFSILILSFIPASVINIFGTLITATGNLKALNIVGFLSLVLNVSLNFLLIPKYQVIGAAASNLATQLFLAITQSIVVRKKFGTLFFNPTQIIFFTISVSVVAYVINTLIHSWGWSFVLTGISGVLLGLTIGLTPIKEIIAIMKSYTPIKTR